MFCLRKLLFNFLLFGLAYSYAYPPPLPPQFYEFNKPSDSRWMGGNYSWARWLDYRW